MRSEKQVKDKIFLYRELLKSRESLMPFHQAMLRKQIKDLEWVLGEGTDIDVAEETKRQFELSEKLKKLIDG